MMVEPFNEKTCIRRSSLSRAFADESKRSDRRSLKGSYQLVAISEYMTELKTDLIRFKEHHISHMAVP